MLREARHLLGQKLTDIDQLTRELRESEARYRRLADNLPVIIFHCWDEPGWPMTYMSQATEEITGHPPSAFVEDGLLFGALILEADLPGLIAAVEQQIAVGELFQSEYRIRRRDGAVRWIEVHSRRRRQDDGRYFYEGTLTDITERKRTTLQLAERAESLDRLRIAAEAGRIAPFTWHVESDLNETVPFGAELHGFAPGELPDERMSSYLARVHPDDAMAMQQQLAAMLAASEGHFAFEYRTISGTGRVRWVRSACQRRQGADGEKLVTGAVLDATLEIEIQHTLEERTREMERANAELDEFTYIASHDLKEPLRGIHNYARFLAEDYADKLDAGGQHMLSAVSQQAERMQRLIEDLLEIARLGREPMKQAETDLDAVVDEVLASLSFSLAEKKVEVRRQPLGRITCDRVRVAEVFRNLITNALKYNDKPVPLVEIGRRESATGESEFTVQDNGIGIKPDFHARVFAPFKRLHAKEAYGGGSGVGLAIVKRIVEAHGGHIGVSSQPGEGATFAFTLSGEHFT